jgi:hypothetical protein
MLIPAKMGMGQKFVAKSAFGTYGTSDSQFNTPSGTAVMSNGDILVTDYYNNRIVQFNILGVLVIIAIQVKEFYSFQVDIIGVSID